jgi:hypothetical protein
MQMKKNIFISLIFIMIWGCKKNDDPVVPEIKTDTTTYILKTHDIKTSGPQYFRFDTKDTTSNGALQYDLVFLTTSIYQKTDEGQMMKVTSPVIKVSQGGSIAIIENSQLTDITSIPTTAKFKIDSAASAAIAKTWYDQNNTPKKNVYIISSYTGKFFAVMIKSADYISSSSQIKNIKVLYKELTSSGGLAIDSFTVADSYTGNFYASIQKKTVIDETDSDIFFKGSELWLGITNKIAAMENKTINDINSIPTGLTYQEDKQLKYVTEEWYEYSGGSRPILTPKNWVLILKLSGGKNYAVKIGNYYNDVNKSGTFTIYWKNLP